MPKDLSCYNMLMPIYHGYYIDSMVIQECGWPK